MKNYDGFLAILKEVDGVTYLLSNCADLINNHLRKGEKWEPLTLYLSELLLDGVKNPVVIDVGANLGAYSIPIAKKIKMSGGKVYAYEAQRMVYYQYCANAFLNNLTNCYINHLAIGDTEDDIDVPLLDISTNPNLGALSLDPAIRSQQNFHIDAGVAFERVRLAPLDSLGLPVVNLIKIDVEGLEYEVLSGAKKLLAASNFPPILFEVWGDYMPGMLQKKERLLAMLKNTGYETTLMGELALAEYAGHKKLSITVNNGKVAICRSEQKPQAADSYSA